MSRVRPKISLARDGWSGVRVRWAEPTSSVIRGSSISHTYARTEDQTFNYFSSFTNTQNPFGTTSGTLTGSSTGKVSTQGVTVTINMAFPRRP